MGRESEERRAYCQADAMIASGSRYPEAFLPGTRVSLEIDEASGRIIVTCGGGLVKLGHLVGQAAELTKAGLRRGIAYTGRVIAVVEREGQLILRLEIDPPLG